MTEAPITNVQAAESKTPPLKLRLRRFADPFVIDPPEIPPIPIYV